MLARVVQTTFHRRLVLLAAVSLLGGAALTLQAARLTLADGRESRARAEAKLVTRQWTPTVRGKILDRKGRVLAEERPSYDVAVEFAVISGSWAGERARVSVRRAYRHQWPEMTEAQRGRVIEAFERSYEEHLSLAWVRVAQALGRTDADLRAEIQRTVERVDRRYRAVVERRYAEEMARAAARSEPLSPAELRAAERRSAVPIWEQRAAHPIAKRLGDHEAMALSAVIGQTTTLTLGENAQGEPVTELVEVLPGVRLVGSGDRLYPMDIQAVEIDRGTLPGPLRGRGPTAVTVEGVASHVVGWMRSGVQREDIEQRAARASGDPAFARRVMTGDGRDRGAYDESGPESVGAVGVEASMEHTLRGLRGERVRRLDTGETETLDAVPGIDVTLSIDAHLQARVQAVMSPEVGLGVVQPWHGSRPTFADGSPDPAYRAPGTRLNGAAVVLEIDSGDVLAMVSAPTVSRGDLAEDPSRVFGDGINAPSLNRAIARMYPPGSVAKAIMLPEAAKAGVYRPGDGIECHGHLFPNNENAFRCWVFKRTQGGARVTHSAIFGGPLSASDALTVSCNVFFFTLGQRLGVRGVAAAYEDFGVGTPFNLGVGLEATGVIGAMTPSAPRGDRSALTIHDAIQMGIGQGPVAWTPLHAADALATLARMGVAVSPRVILDDRPRGLRRLGLDPAACAETLEGLGRSVNEEMGTGHHITYEGPEGHVREPTFNAADVWVWGKTGTAAGLEMVDPDGPDGPLPPRRIEGDHSWYVVLVGRPSDRRPRFAIAVLMEYAGSGGKVSGPIANQIVHALIAEGYL
ncbi:MAG: hypothetical protein HRU70_14845 [Phycisphaeraceae bacterium]|nr:MAG: hypothetical protein HRU70_14845 [Phycisphaeraceae bacterium]